jgi:beta-galactosidase
MYFGVDYYPEHWVFPYGGTAENPEAVWEQDAELMAKAGINVVRIGEFSWGICEPEEGKHDFLWLRRVMDIMARHDIKVILGTPTAAPPVWLAKKHPEILPLDDKGIVKHEGTRRAICLSSDIYWDYSKRIVIAMAEALGDHPQLIAWQIDNGMGANDSEFSFNDATRKEWQMWLEAKYEKIETLNDLLGLRFWGQTVSSWNQVPMPMRSPAPHIPALLLDWNRFSSDTMVQFVKMQADLWASTARSIP